MTKSPPNTAARPLFLVYVLALALALRVWGITWGLPSAAHYFSYHPDESVMLIKSSLTMNVFAGRLLPHFYDYGSLQLYLVCFANTLAALFGAVDIVPKSFAEWYPQWAKMYLIGRLLTVGMGVGTVWVTYTLGATLWGRRAGLVAALILAVMPLHAEHSHFLTVDVPATFWGMLSLLWSARLATGPKPLRAALFAGLFAGLAAATKYNMALAVLPLLLASYASSPSRFGRVSANGLLRIGTCAGVGLLASLLAFFAACPGSLLETGSFSATGTFLHDVHFEAVHVQNPDDPTFRDTGNGFVYHITHNLDAGLGLPLLLLVLASTGYALYRRQRGDALLAAFVLPYYVLISLAAVRYARYTIPLLPILALWVGRMLADGSRSSLALPRKSAEWAGGAVAVLTLIWCLRLVGFMAAPDTRDWAYGWVNVPAVSTVGFAVQPWFGTVPISPYFTLPGPGTWQAVTPLEVQKRIVYSGKDWDGDTLAAKLPDVVVLSEYDYMDALRLKNPNALRYLQVLNKYYKRQFALVDGNPALSTQYTLVEGMPTRGWPHDMLYVSPIISIYRRR